MSLNEMARGKDGLGRGREGMRVSSFYKKNKDVRTEVLNTHSYYMFLLLEMKFIFLKPHTYSPISRGGSRRISEGFI